MLKHRFEALNSWAEQSKLGAYFQLKERNTSLMTEFRAGTVTFLTMAYILAVNGSIVADTGGPCGPADCQVNKGMPGCQFAAAGGLDPGFATCKERVRRSMVTATSVSSMVACFLMGAVGNLPFAIAPGMGINAFFTYTVVGYLGMGGMGVTYQQALAAAFVEGWIIFLIAVTGLRHAFVKLMPSAVLLGTSGGIGMFIAFIGFQTSNGIGLISFDSATLVTLGGCPASSRVYLHAIKDPSAVCITDPTTGMLVEGPNIGAASSAYTCASNRMRSPSLWLGIFGGMLMVVLMARGFRGAIIMAILFVTFISWIPGHAATYLGADSQIPFGEERLAYFRQVVTVPDVMATDFELDFGALRKGNTWAVLMSLLYLDFLDTTGTFYSMATYISKKLPGFIDPVRKEFPGITAAYCVDATAIWLGALLGIPPLTTYIESSTGIREGGRTGLTAITTSFYFLLAMFFTPIMASIPPYATGPALILVGALMMENLLDVEWKDPLQAVPAFLTISVIPLTYSVAYGVVAGIMSYIVLWTLITLYDVLTAPLLNRSCVTVLRSALPPMYRDAFRSLVRTLNLQRSSGSTSAASSPETSTHPPGEGSGATGCSSAPADARSGGFSRSTAGSPALLAGGGSHGSGGREPRPRKQASFDTLSSLASGQAAALLPSAHTAKPGTLSSSGLVQRMSQPPAPLPGGAPEVFSSSRYSVRPPHAQAMSAASLAMHPQFHPQHQTGHAGYVGVMGAGGFYYPGGMQAAPAWQPGCAGTHIWTNPMGGPQRPSYVSYSPSGMGHMGQSMGQFGPLGQAYSKGSSNATGPTGPSGQPGHGGWHDPLGRPTHPMGPLVGPPAPTGGSENLPPHMSRPPDPPLP